MRLSRLRRMVRQFPENGMKLLLEDPRNVRDLLALSDSELVGLIDYDNLKLVRTTFVARDYRHVEADVVLTAPLRKEIGPQGRKRIWLYMLVEHQSAPQRFMILRMLDYVVQIYKAQIRSSKQREPAIVLQPVLPIVFYTGVEPWETLGSLADWMAVGDRFRPVLPTLKPLFLNLRALPARRLSASGYFGSVLRLVQKRRARPQAFRDLLQEVVLALETMRPVERTRWLELVSYVLALVYHERHGSEVPHLQEVVEAAVQTDHERQGISIMGQTYAQMLEAKGRRQGRKEGREEGREEGRQEGEVRALRTTLLRMLQRRFADLPARTEEIVNQTDDVIQLGAWLEAVLNARALGDVGIYAPR